MRLLIKLRSTENTPYEREYHLYVQGLIYNILRGSKYDNHDKLGYKQLHPNEICKNQYLEEILRTAHLNRAFFLLSQSKYWPMNWQLFILNVRGWVG